MAADLRYLTWLGLFRLASPPAVTPPPADVTRQRCIDYFFRRQRGR